MAGYTRQDTANNIANGNVIDADDFDAEFNAIEAGFNASTGHSHDGTAGEGAPIEKVGPSQDLVVTSTQVLPKTTNTLDLGSTAVQFKNAYFDGTVDSDAFVGPLTGAVTGNVTGNLTGNVTGDLTGAVTGNVTGNVTGDVTGDLVGNVTGNVTGNLTGNVTGDLTGDVTGNVTGNLTGNVTGNVTGAVTGNADTASTWKTARSITLTGDVTGTVASVNGGANISIATTVAANSVALGTDTTGSYVGSLVAGTGVSLSNNTGEGATPTIAIGQAVATNSDVTFNDVVVSGNLTVSGTTTQINTETLNLADNEIVLNSNYSGNSPTENAGIEVNRGGGTAPNKSLVWDETADKWTVGTETFVAGTFDGNLTGNAGSATALANARTISLTGDVTGSVSFDGGTDVSIAATVQDDSHNHIISNVDGLQTALDAKAALAGSGSQAFTASTLNATTVDLGNWTVTETGGVLYFATGGVNKMKIDASGNLTVTGNVTAYGTV